MSDISIVTQLALFADNTWPPKKPAKPATFHHYWLHPEQWPAFVVGCPLAQRYLDLLGPLDWECLPERNLQRNWGRRTIPSHALCGAMLIKLAEGIHSFAQLHRFLCEHPSLVWLCGFPLYPAPQTPLGFNARKSLPTARHLTYLLRHLPNAALQAVLHESVQHIRRTLAARNIPCGDCIAMDTKHILAWVKENNPKAYVPERYNKAKQPHGDPDCRLGCKRHHNQKPSATTPTRNPISARKASAGAFYWGYGSGIVVTQVAGYGEFVVAELTQSFDQGDVSYFFPLMRQTEHRLGHKPRYGIFDAAFDAWYVYAYFYDESEPTRGFAAVPFSEKGGYKVSARKFSPTGLPVCAAGLDMPLRCAFTDRTSCLVEHERGQYVCPLQFPQRTRNACPVHAPRWKKGGCTVMMPTSIGARLRYTLNRDSAEYKDKYRQRTACERVNSQAVALGIERPHLRNGSAIANQNTLIYTLINLRFVQRLRQQCERAA